MRRIITIAFMFVAATAVSQTKLDSLWKIWRDPHQPDTARFEALSCISFDGYIYSNPDSAFYFAQMLYNLATNAGNKKYQGQALNIQGTTFYFRGDYVRAIDYFTRSLKIREEVGDKRGEASCINNMGAIYTDQNQQVKARECYLRSLKIREAIGDKEGIAASYNNIGATYAEQKDYTQAIEYYTRSLKIRTELGDNGGIATAYNNIGRIYTYLNDVKMARSYFDRGLRLREDAGDKRGLALSLFDIGLTYYDEGDIKTAIDYYQRSMKISNELRLALTVFYCSEGLYHCYKKTGQWGKALEMYELSVKMNDSIKSEDSQKEIMKQEMQYSYEKQKALDEKENEKKIAISAEQQKKQKAISYATALGLLLVIIFAFFIFSRLRLTRKQKVMIENQKMLVDEKQKEILDSITYAKRLQDAILPSNESVKQLLPESFILYRPKDIVAGDFYWLEQVNGHIYIAAADCTGHGVPGAMVSVVCSNALNRAVLEFGIREPGKILDKTRELVLETFSRSDSDVKDGMDISLCTIDKNTNEVKWAGANNPLWYISYNELQEIKAEKQPIGKSENPRPFTTHLLQLKKGDSLFLFTDGFADQFGGSKGKKFKHKQLKELLQANAELSPGIQKEKLEATLMQWMGNLEQVDDICVIGVRL